MLRNVLTENGGPSGDSIVRHSGVATGQNDVDLAANGGSTLGDFRYSQGETSLDGGGSAKGISNREHIAIVENAEHLRCEHWSSDCDESAIDLRLAVFGSNGVAWCQQRDLGASGDFLWILR